MSFNVYLTSTFERSAKGLSKKHRSLKSDLMGFIRSLEANPIQGDEIAPGVRKIRMAITSKGRGKSAGARVITYTILVSEQEGDVYLLDIYDKSEFTTVDETVLKAIIKDLGL